MCIVESQDMCCVENQDMCCVESYRTFGIWGGRRPPSGIFVVRRKTCALATTHVLRAIQDMYVGRPKAALPFVETHES
jgi:hypothetical protein